jgi:phosphoribosylpyrophosphate synthetase
LLQAARRTFLVSYTKEKTKNQFTKVQMNYLADQVLQKYFKDNAQRIENWFNIISPSNSIIKSLEAELAKLRAKNWTAVHSL